MVFQRREATVVSLVVLISAFCHGEPEIMADVRAGEIGKTEERRIADAQTTWEKIIQDITDSYVKGTACTSMSQESCENSLDERNEIKIRRFSQTSNLKP